MLIAIDPMKVHMVSNMEKKGDYYCTLCGIGKPDSKVVASDNISDVTCYTCLSVLVAQLEIKKLLKDRSNENYLKRLLPKG